MPIIQSRHRFSPGITDACLVKYQTETGKYQDGNTLAPGLAEAA
jgi:hypothetical protein